MSKQFGISSLLAAAASLLVVGMVAVGSASPAAAASEEDLAAPQGSFVSSLAAPDDRGVYAVRDREQRPAPIVTASEEDAAVPPGSFTSTMAAPEIHGNKTRLASDSGREKQAAKVSLSEIVADGLE